VPQKPGRSIKSSRVLSPTLRLGRPPQGDFIAAHVGAT
jgi:hypothetical protein